MRLISEAIVTALNLEPHLEGGYYRRTFQADQQPLIETVGGPRYLMTSIYYLLTTDSPIGQFHFNQSDIVHYYHLGDAIRYSLCDPPLKMTISSRPLKPGHPAIFTFESDCK